MKLEGFYCDGVDIRKREKDDKVVERYTLILRNRDGDRISVTTESKELKKFCTGEDVDLELRQHQTIFSEVEDGKDKTGSA
jgi:hypothetical protein